MNDLLDFEALKISIASPEMIKGWSFGEVTKPETINYRTLKAEKDGLFSENIFGPTKDFECYCGKYKRIRYRGVICDKCGVEVTQSKVRRERMGHINLASPVAHNWFVKGAPSKLALVLDMTMKSLEAIIYFASYLVIEVDSEAKVKALESLDEQLKVKIEETKKLLDTQIEEREKALKTELAGLKKKVKESEKFDIASSDLQLKSRQEIATLREANNTEISQLESIYKTVSDLVKSTTPLKLLSEDEYNKLYEYLVADFVKVGMGAEALLEVLKKTDLDKLSADLRVEVSQSTGQRHIKATKRLRLIEGMRSSKMSPEWMVMSILPVLPPDLRPMVQLPGGRFATSDLNDLYRRVINRNNRLKRLVDLGAPEIILRNEKRMLQEAVDSLIDSSVKTSRRVGGAGAHQLRSLSDMLRGKQGRFRQNLLGKRVDYSGRSVIIVGPKLKLNQVGVPKEMALEVFKPFVLREMIQRGLASNVKGAKNVLEFRPPEVWDILEQVIENHPILINRAPTLHRLGIQAFYPILIDGNAIQIHPCICAGFNADFDGDQMAIHIPLSEKSKAEATELMMARENILKGSDGSAVNIPNKEMVLGTYYITSVDSTLEKIDKVYSKELAMYLYQVGKLPLRQLIKCIIKGEVLETTVGRIIFNDFLPEELQFINDTVGVNVRRIMMEAFKKLSKDAVAELVDNIKSLGFWGATISGLSLAISDNKIIPEKEKMIAAGDKEISEIEGNFKKGLITEEEKRALSEEVWTRIGNEIARKTFDSLDPENPIQIIIKSGGARATSEQIKQISGMRGFSVDPTGKIVELPTKSNYREGLKVFEYFTSCRGARKGVADRAIRTAEAGYLTRRLVDVSHDVIIRLDDCGTTDSITLEVSQDNPTVNNSRFMGRMLAEDILDPKNKKVVYKKGEFMQEEEILNLTKLGVKQVSVKSPLTCQARFGMCANCYGLDLTTRKLVSVGIPVGVVAAQSIGEPGTQLTMRTFHSGGVVGVDITQGLPRVEELFEVRMAKNASPISELAGKVSVTESDNQKIIRVRTTSKPHEEREYLVPVNSPLLVEDGDLISSGAPLIGGALDIKEVLRIQGLRAAQRYIVEQVREVYESQGVSINEKHFEVIVRKMSDKVRVESQGDTKLLPGEVTDRNTFEEENTRVLSEGGEPATAAIVILGITRASLQTDSFLSAASFQETTTVLSEAAAQGKVDHLLGLKENVIIGRLIPTSPDRARIEQ